MGVELIKKKRTFAGWATSPLCLPIDEAGDPGGCRPRGAGFPEHRLARFARRSAAPRLHPGAGTGPGPPPGLPSQPLGSGLDGADPAAAAALPQHPGRRPLGTATEGAPSPSDTPSGPGRRPRQGRGPRIQSRRALASGRQAFVATDRRGARGPRDSRRDSPPGRGIARASRPALGRTRRIGARLPGSPAQPLSLRLHAAVSACGDVGAAGAFGRLYPDRPRPAGKVRPLS